MTRQLFCLVFSAMLFALHCPVDAQQPAKIPRLGFLAASTGPGESSRPAAVTEGLREIGYVEGKNIVIEWRQAEGKLDRLAAFADELVRLKVDVILTAGSTATRARRCRVPPSGGHRSGFAQVAPRRGR